MVVMEKLENTRKKKERPQTTMAAFIRPVRASTPRASRWTRNAVLNRCVIAPTSEKNSAIGGTHKIFAASSCAFTDAASVLPAICSITLLTRQFRSASTMFL